MRISPSYKVSHWQSLNFSTEGGWQEAIEIFKDRIRGRFLEPISRMELYGYAGFAVIALDCLLIETLQQFKEGLSRSSSSRDSFVRFLTESSFSSYFSKEAAGLFYEQIRCGILHQAETKGSSRIVARRDSPLVEHSHDGKGLVINRCLFHKQLVSEFEAYIARLRDASNVDLRMKFKRKMDHICRISKAVTPKHE